MKITMQQIQYEQIPALIPHDSMVNHELQHVLQVSQQPNMQHIDLAFTHHDRASQALQDS